MSTLALDLPEVNSAPSEDLDLDVWSDEHADAMAEEALLEAAWDKACDLGYLTA